jgi:DNA-directed RNA polymerase specialized sigma24 family protein
MNKDVKKIEEKLDVIIYLLAKDYLEQLKTQKDKILFLYDLKIEQKEIANLLDIPYSTVTARVSENR